MVELLRGLASSGRAVVTTIHQPSSNIYRQLDTVLLLSQGHPIYYGEQAPGCCIASWMLVWLQQQQQLGSPRLYRQRIRLST